SLMQSDPAKHLYIIVHLFDYPPCGLPYRRKSPRQDVVESFTLGKLRLEQRSCPGKLRVAHCRELAVESHNLIRDTSQPFKLPVVIRRKDFSENSHSLPPL